jgi:DNA-binding GntR family transcriptional regulator
MIDIQPPPVEQTDPDRYSWCQFALHSAFAEMAKRAVTAGWNEREVAAALVDLADQHMLGLVTMNELEAIIEAIKKQS